MKKLLLILALALWPSATFGEVLVLSGSYERA